MGYFVGIDLGTTFTAAAINRDGRVEMVSLGQHTSAVPSVVFLRETDEMLMGEPAERRGVTDPTRVAREFKRRMGDTAPIMLGSSPYSAERITAALLRFVLHAVATQEGGPPDGVAITYPANWGPYKVENLREAAKLAEVRDAVLLTEPFAAAVHYASTERVDPGDVIAVYDLGGGTFDAAVLRKTAAGFEQLGRPEGIEHLGGVDFDEAVFRHVRTALGTEFDALDQNDPNVRAAVTRLAQDCVAAKEALSTDSDATIHVILPGLQSEIRLTRGEFEAMIRSTLRETVDALRRALAAASVQPSDLKAVLLVGGSSRIPLVSEMVTAELGRPVAVDAHPKHAVALGAALVMGSARRAAPAASTAVAATATGSAVPTAGTPAAATASPAAAAPTTASAPPSRPVDPGGAVAGAPPPGTPAIDKPARRRGPLVAVIVGAVAVALAIVAAVLASQGGGGDSVASSPGTSGTNPGLTCESASGRCAFLTGVELDGDTYVATYTVKGFQPIIYEPGVKGKPDDHHVHFFFDTVGADHAGANGTQPVGPWTVWDRASGHGELRFDAFTLQNQDEQGGQNATQLCILVADSDHNVETDSGNCLPLPEP
jgi:actin-like ATPase involved in cell morphogenesis